VELRSYGIIELQKWKGGRPSSLQRLTFLLEHFLQVPFIALPIEMNMFPNPCIEAPRAIFFVMRTAVGLREAILAMKAWVASLLNYSQSPQRLSLTKSHSTAFFISLGTSCIAHLIDRLKSFPPPLYPFDRPPLAWQSQPSEFPFQHPKGRQSLPEPLKSFSSIPRSETLPPESFLLRKAT